jgi:hypothetical protein
MSSTPFTAPVLNIIPSTLSNSIGPLLGIVKTFDICQNFVLLVVVKAPIHLGEQMLVDMGSQAFQDQFEGVPTIGAREFVDLHWAHRTTTFATLGETLAYTGSTQWEAVWNEMRLRLQWEWSFEPYFQRPFTMDMQPRSNAVFAPDDFVDHLLPVAHRIKTLRVAIDRIDWEQCVLNELYKQDAELKGRVEALFKGLGTPPGD